MAVEKCYHGTVRETGERYITTQQVILSEYGESRSREFKDLWLGDGFYLFDQDFFAFKWITQKSQIQSTSEIEERLKREYIILSVTIQRSQARTFDLRNLSHKRLFDQVLVRINNSELTEHIVPRGKVPDGIAINYLFNELGYKQFFDVVVATYTFNQNNYVNIESTKQGYIVQLQYCVKNTHIIQNITEFDITSSIDEYLDIWEDLFPTAKPFGIPDKSIYTVSDKGYDYEY